MEALEIHDSTDAMKNITRYVDWEVLSIPQKWIISQIVNFNYSRRRIAATWNEKFGENLRLEAIGTAIHRTALSRRWDKGMHGGNQSYLCDEDMKLLEQEIKERAMMCKALNTVTILDQAEKLKNRRIQKAFEFLNALGAEKSAQNLIEDDVGTPCRTWINNITKKIDVYLAKVQFVDGKRFFSCSFSVLDEFFDKFGDLMSTTPPELLFSVDETMLDLQHPTKVVVPDSVRQYYEPKPPDFPHITVMCATNVVSSKVPLFFELANLKKSPSELNSLVDPGTIWLASTES